MTTINPPSEDIVDMLESSESGLTLSPIYIAITPTTPSDVVTVIDSGGMSQMKYSMERPNIQILVRNKVYKTGYNMIKNIKYYLDEKSNEVWNAARYISIRTRSEIGYVGMDPKNRYEFSLNFQIYRTPYTG
jgi:hypothetical protein